ncbi:MAG: response regulator receiver protein [Pedosphaera sp.]|nr:response regulator receiver protein [Pedosphaera sp.]
MSKQAKENYLVLVADDSDDDRFLLKKAMQRASRLQIVGELTNGSDVINYFKGHAHFHDRVKFPLPDLLLLDLKMPLKDGFEVLTWLRTQSLKHLTVVLTDSMHAEHIKRALDLGADLFQVKPRMPHDMAAMILALEERLLLSGRTPVRHPHPSAIPALW